MTEFLFILSNGMCNKMKIRNNRIVFSLFGQIVGNNTCRFQKPCNVILVDWGNGSGFPYNQATANTRVVGEEIAALITSLNRVLGTTNSNYHLIGHSLGAHIAGYAGSRLPQLGRITGI
jgi:pimeloyl-ACP methyl ester carboxylesterase